MKYLKIQVVVLDLLQWLPIGLQYGLQLHNNIKGTFNLCGKICGTGFVQVVKHLLKSVYVALAQSRL